MADPNLQYFPVTLPFLLLLTVLFILIAGMIAGKILRYASIRMGVGPRVMVTALLLSLLLSYVNIPIAYLPELDGIFVTGLVAVILASFATRHDVAKP